MRKKQNASIMVQIPSEALTDGGLFQQGGYLLMLQSLTTNNQYLDVVDSKEYNIAKINTIRKEFVQAILSKPIEDGYKIDILNWLSGQAPYVHIDKTLLDEVPSFLEGEENAPLLKDYTSLQIVDDLEDETKVYVEIGHLVNGGRDGLTSYEELKQWATAYGVTNVQIIDRIEII